MVATKKTKLYKMYKMNSREICFLFFMGSIIGAMLGVSTWTYVDITKSQQGVVVKSTSMLVCNESTIIYYFDDGSEIINTKSGRCSSHCVKDNMVVGCRDATGALGLMIGAVISFFLGSCCFFVERQAHVERQAIVESQAREASI
jgi:hypothetical protein